MEKYDNNNSAHTNDTLSIRHTMWAILQLLSIIHRPKRAANMHQVWRNMDHIQHNFGHFWDDLETQSLDWRQQKHSAQNTHSLQHNTSKQLTIQNPKATLVLSHSTTPGQENSIYICTDKKYQRLIDWLGFNSNLAQIGYIVPLMRMLQYQRQDTKQ